MFTLDEVAHRLRMERELSTPQNSTATTMTKLLAIMLVGVLVATMTVLLVITTRLPAQEAEANDTLYEVVSEVRCAGVTAVARSCGSMIAGRPSTC